MAYEKQKSDAWCAAAWGPDFLLIDRTDFIFGNALFKNRGIAPWQEASEGMDVETYWPWGISVADFNADGFEDIFVTAGMGYPFRYGIQSLLLNDAGKKFFATEFVLGIEPRKRGPLIEYFKLDCTGADAKAELCYHRTEDLRVLAATSSRSSAAFDLDNDGDLDLVVNNMNDHPQVFLSNLAAQRKLHFLKILLKGTKSNADGLGAVVKVHAGGREWMQQHDGKSGYLSQSSMPMYFGLGDAAEVSGIEENWPQERRQSRSWAGGE